MRIVSYIIIGIMVIIFITPLNNINTSNEIWNYLLRTAYHANATHLIANMLTFYGLSFIENEMGHYSFLLAILFIWIISSIMLYVYHTIVPSKKVYTIGFSGVIYGLIVVYISLLGDQSNISIFDLIGSLVPQLFVSQISIEGHFFGILAGFLYVTFFGASKKKLTNVN
jgi:membrane associated rhomboid family serine protease